MTNEKIITLTKNAEGMYELFPSENPNLSIYLKNPRLADNYPWIQLKDSKKGNKWGQGENIYLNENNIVKGVCFIENYRLFELMNKSKKIPEIKFWTGDGLIGTMKARSISKLYKDFLKKTGFGGLEPFGHVTIKEKYEWIKYLSKKIKLNEDKIDMIVHRYPFDDNNKTIKENDLVKLILK